MGVIRGLTIILEDTHWYFFIAGFVFLGIGFALYEAEENDIQNWLKDSHKKLDDIAKKFIGKHSSAISIFAAKVSYFLDRTFGTSILGMGNLLATCNLSILSFYVFEFVLILMMVHSAHGNYRDLFLTNWSMEAWLLCFIALLLFPLSISFNKYRGYWGWLVFIGTILYLANILTIQPRDDNGVGGQIIDSWLHKHSWFASSDDFFFLSSCEFFYFIAILVLMQTTRLLRITVKLGIEKNPKFVEWFLTLLYFCVLFLTLVVFIVTFKTEKLNDVYVSYLDIHNYFTLAL